MMYKTITTTSTLPAAEYIKNYRDTDTFIKFCKECNRYGACWACPPFNFNVDEYLSRYDTAIIIGTKIILHKNLRRKTTPAACKETTEQLFTTIRSNLDKVLLKAELTSSGRAFFAGTCHLCLPDACTRKLGLPCKHPDKIRPSLEACGFDLSRTATELLNIDIQWEANGKLPEYLTLISGFFINKKDVENFTTSVPDK